MTTPFIPNAAPAARRPAGFTLIELLVVIAIIAVLAALVFPVFTKMKIAGQKTESISRLRNIFPILQAYTTDHNGFLPVSYSSATNPRTGGMFGSWMHQLNQEGYIKPQIENLPTSTMFSCPRQLAMFTPGNGDLRTFAMNARIGNNTASAWQGARSNLQIARPSQTAFVLSGAWDESRKTFQGVADERYRRDNEMAPEETPFDGSVLILYADGHTDARALDTIPKTVQQNDPDGGYDFWLGGVRNTRP